MPDLDIISRHVPRGWRTPMRLLLNRAAPGEEVGRAILRALTACLRENRGFPGFNDFLSVLRARGAGQIDAHAAYTLVDAIERQYAHQRHAKIAGRAARQMVAEFGQAGRLDANLPEALAHRCCRSLIDHNLLGYVTPQAVGKHYPGAAEAEARGRECLDILREQLRRVARGVAFDAACRGIRAPKLPAYHRRVTRELLDQPLM